MHICYVCAYAYNKIKCNKNNESIYFFFCIPPKNFNSPSFINVGRKTPFLEKNEIQALA